MREDDGKSAMTLIRKDLPRFRLALAALRFPLQHSIYQQLHNYPVGSGTGEAYKEGAKGSKYNVTPTRRAFLSDIAALVCIKENDEFEAQVLAGLHGEAPRAYGLPFLGDNSFLPDRLEQLDEPRPAHWFVPVGPEEPGGLRDHVTRLTVSIDRADMSQTTSHLFAPTKNQKADIPENAWVPVGY